MRFPFLRSESTPTNSAAPSPPEGEYTPDEVSEEERARAREQFMTELEARAAEGPESVAEFFETLAEIIRLSLLTPEDLSRLIAEAVASPAQGAEQQPLPDEQPSQAQQPAEEPAPQEPQQETKTESVRERIFSPRSASSRARGKSLREILNI